MPQTPQQAYSNLLLSLGLVAGSLSRPELRERSSLSRPELRERLQSDVENGSVSPYYLGLVRDGLAEVLTRIESE